MNSQTAFRVQRSFYIEQLCKRRIELQSAEAQLRKIENDFSSYADYIVLVKQIQGLRQGLDSFLRGMLELLGDPVNFQGPYIGRLDRKWFDIVELKNTPEMKTEVKQYHAVWLAEVKERMACLLVDKLLCDE
jgi:hypothetical protein